MRKIMGLLAVVGVTAGLSVGVSAAPAAATIKVPLPNVLPIVGGVIRALDGS